MIKSHIFSPLRMNYNNKKRDQSMIEREKYMQARVVNYHGVNSIEINGKIFQYVGYRSWTPKEKYLRAFDDLGFPFMTMLPSGIKNTLFFIARKRENEKDRK